MVYKELKRLRQVHDFTLKELSSKVGYGTGNLSSYENGKLKARDETVMRILTRGYNMSQEEAEIRLAIWRRKEVEEKYTVLSSPSEAYNEPLKIEFKKVVNYLKKKGVEEIIIKGLSSL